MYVLTKKLRFESAHRLALGYEGKCANIHGHSWNGKVAIEVEGTDKQGLAVDFSWLKKFCKEVEDSLDHKIILQQDDKEIIALCMKNNWAVVITKKNPTCETLSEIIYNEAEMFFTKHKDDFFGKKITIKWVKIEETCTTSCKFKPKTPTKI